jgi:hypothetical protein
VLIWRSEGRLRSECSGWASMPQCEIELAGESNANQKHTSRAERVSNVLEGSRRFLLSQGKPSPDCEDDTHHADPINADKEVTSG